MLFIITILFTLSLPFILSRMIEKFYGNIINLSAVKAPEDKALNEEKLRAFLVLGYLFPTVFLAILAMIEVFDSTNEFILQFATLLLLFITVIIAAFTTGMLENKASELATVARKTFTSTQGSEAESKTQNAPKHHEWMKNLHSDKGIVSNGGTTREQEKGNV